MQNCGNEGTNNAQTEAHQSKMHYKALREIENRLNRTRSEQLAITKKLPI
jgi:hypothetical protein